jgi:hypothetical protein
MTTYGGWVDTTTMDTGHLDGPTLKPGEAIYYQNGGAEINFTRSFSAQ